RGRGEREHRRRRAAAQRRRGDVRVQARRQARRVGLRGLAMNVVLLIAEGTSAAPLIRTVVAAGARPVAVETSGVAASAHDALVLADLRGDVAGLAAPAIGLWSGQDAAELAGLTSFAALGGSAEELRAVLDDTCAGRPAVAP